MSELHADADPGIRNREIGQLIDIVENEVFNKHLLTFSVLCPLGGDEVTLYNGVNFSEMPKGTPEWHEVVAKIADIDRDIETAVELLAETVHAQLTEQIPQADLPLFADDDPRVVEVFKDQNADFENMVTRCDILVSVLEHASEADPNKSTNICLIRILGPVGELDFRSLIIERRVGDGVEQSIHVTQISCSLLESDYFIASTELDMDPEFSALVAELMPPKEFNFEWLLVYFAAMHAYLKFGKAELFEDLIEQCGEDIDAAEQVGLMVEKTKIKLDELRSTMEFEEMFDVNDQATVSQIKSYTRLVTELC